MPKVTKSKQTRKDIENLPQPDFVIQTGLNQVLRISPKVGAFGVPLIIFDSTHQSTSIINLTPTMLRALAKNALEIADDIDACYPGVFYKELST